MKLKLLFVLLVFQVSFAQHRTCGMQEKMAQIMSNPAQRQAYLEQQSKFDVELQKVVSNKNGNSVNNIIRIPVAVHFPSVATTSTQKVCFRTLAQSQINILNADYNGTNADISNFVNDASFYPGTNTGSLQVEFVLATQNHPAGTGLVNGDLAVTFGTDFLGNNDNDATWAGYLNLVCRNAGNGILGYSPLGGSPSAGMTVVIAKSAFGSGNGCTGYVPGSPYDLGRTLTHELGHFFNLDHTFESCDGANCATSGDRVCDTPSLSIENYDCPVAGDVAGCQPTEYALTMNYMDYVNDACMYMFTAGQAARMQAWYNTIASQFKTDVLGNESFLQNDFSIFPNPSKGSFTIQFKDIMIGYSVEVFDVTGKTIYENNYDQSANLNQVINLDNATSGVYFVNIKSDKGIVTKKLVIE
ncbi:zinc-dependent metalloprotease [Flavobacterium paronense]|uniref:Zinc-dependent metalloprotease n=1 Tax=Flavobacterium paronense TaxID=1392775 RepID=A0ABV5GEA1_9FLAO|nr:zinc-dependent metalloprotease [Flavobacterium paronense]MDN3678256.1 zinc-dependent metalloprotease [Flavobacterium paronense]